MKTYIILSAFALIALSSCDSEQNNDPQKQEIPQALDNSSSYKSSGRSHDLVESLYQELKDKTPELQELDRKMDALSKSESDSTAAFVEYDEKNQSYYNAANLHTSRIKDSMLRLKVKDMIAHSLAQYNTNAARHNELMNAIGAKNVSLNDLHTVLKITRTLPVIEQFQKDNLPATKPLEGFSHRLDEALKFADTLTKK